MSKRYKGSSGGPHWTLAEKEQLLLRLLVCDSKRAYQAECNKIAQENEARGHRLDDHGKPIADYVHRYLWGLAINPHHYIYLGNDEIRTMRTGEKFTWAEREVIRHSMTTNSQEAAIMDTDTRALHLAALLRRTRTELLQAMQRYGPGQGRKPLGLV